jgi:hypothetical protein
MARNTFEQDLAGDAVRLKKYFYALRPLLAAGWILERRAVPPMEFATLRTLIDDAAIQQAIDDLLAQKRTADEKTTIAPVPLLHAFIAERLPAYFDASSQLSSHQGEAEPLNQLFRSLLTP